MTPPSSVPAAEDGANSRNVIVVSGRISPRALALCGLVLFALGFWSGRETRDSETVVIAQASAPASAPLATPLPSIAPAISAPAEQRSPSRVTTTIRLMKFAPEKIDLHVGDTIEWQNKDLTPHTVTSAPESEKHELDSGPINAGAVWEHRFETAGTFPYFCTFHPEMKGVVEVK